ncbi:MAG: HIT family protein [Lachnospiraceae bacterium]|nr:HIT family protein [Lachnospiraceae bacterium]
MECDCVFCKIAKGDIPSATLYEDEDLRVILDLGPASKGHALVIPRKHAANLFELPDEIAEKAIVVAKKVAVRLKEGLHADGLNLVQNNGAAAGQTVDHFHIHLIPRYENDTVNVKWQPGTLSETDKEDILKLFQS